MKKEDVTIHIDHKKFTSPDLTTGVDLYILGTINPSQFDIFLDIPGKADDELIPNDTTEIQLKNGAHLYTAQKNLNPGLRRSIDHE
jgi:hypothetical protein